MHIGEKNYVCGKCLCFRIVGRSEHVSLGPFLFTGVAFSTHSPTNPMTNSACVSEMWLDKSVHDREVDVSTCTLYRRDRAVGRGGGILVYVHNSIRSRHRPDLEVKDVEAVRVELHLKSNYVIRIVRLTPTSNHFTLYPT